MSFNSSLDLVKKITDWVSHNGSLKRTSNIINENFVLGDNNKKFYLNTEQWNTVYNMIIQENLNALGSKDNLIYTSENFQLHKLKKHIENSINNIIEQSLPIKSGKKSDYAKIYDVLQNILKEDPKLYCLSTFNIIQNMVFNATLGNKLSSTFAYEEKEVILSNKIGKNIIYSYINTLPTIGSFFFNLISKNNELTETNELLLENFWIELFSIYSKIKSNNKTTLKDSDLSFIIFLLKQNFSLEITSPFLVNLIAINILLQGIYYVNVGDKRYQKILDVLAKKNINHVKLHYMEQYLNNLIGEIYIPIGSIIINQLIETKIFEPFFKFEKKNNVSTTINYIKMDNALTHDFISNTGFLKPLLIPENKNNIRNLTVNSEINNLYFTLNFDNALQKIHKNFTGKGVFLDDSILNTEPAILDSLFCIDNEFLELFLNHLTFLKENIDSVLMKNKNLLEFYFSIFSINIIETYNNISNDFIFILDMLVKYALDLDLYHDTNLFKLLDKNNHAKLLSYYIKIRSYKITLKICLKESIIYSRFGHFINSSFFDFRGRRYLTIPAFNVQGHSFIKAFVKLFEIKQNNFNFLEVKDILINNLNNKSIQEEASKLLNSEQNYNEILDDTINKYFYSYLDPTSISFTDLISFLNSNITLENLINFLLPKLKDKNRSIKLFSYILHEKSKNLNVLHMTNAYSFDITTSGYHNVALLFKKSSLAKKCNLIGEQTKGIYMELNDEFHYQINRYNNFLKIYIETILKTSFDHLFELMQDSYNKEINNLSDSREALITFLTISLDNDKINKLLYIIKNDINLEKKINRFNFTENEWIFSPLKHNFFEFSNEFKLDKQLMLNLYILKSILYYNYNLSLNPWIKKHSVLESRDAFKSGTMTLLYGGKPRGRFNSFMNFFDDFALKLGITSTNTKAIVNIVKYMESFFVYYRDAYLVETKNLVEIGKILASEENPISFQNQNFEVILAPIAINKKEKRITLRQAYGRAPYRLTLRQYTSFNNIISDIKLKINKRKQASLFPPNFIHSMDAMIVHLFMHKTYNIISKTKHLGFFYSEETTHDCFSNGRFLFPLIPLILRDIYMIIYDYDYIRTLRYMQKNINKDFIGYNISEDQYKKILSFCANPDDADYLLNDFKNPSFIKFG